MQEGKGRLSGKVALITGAAQGLGAAYAMALATEGAAVCVSDVTEPAATLARLEKAGARAIGAVADVAEPTSVTAMVDQAKAAFGSIDILINNAALFGKLALKPFLEIASDEWDAVMRVNVRGVFECCKAVVPHMREKGYGKIVNVASGTVFKGTPLLLHYVTSKGAVIALTRCVARELGDFGIRVNCIAPGLTMSENVISNPAWAESIRAANVATRALKRDATASDLLGAVVFLASTESDFMTGQTIVVDGGSVMH